MDIQEEDGGASADYYYYYKSGVGSRVWGRPTVRICEEVIQDEDDEDEESRKVTETRLLKIASFHHLPR